MASHRNPCDGWPLISDAVVDYYNRPKLAYSYIKRVQQDICVMVDEAENEQHKVIAVNDTQWISQLEIEEGTSAFEPA
ncbi:MAG: hypothetical protein OSB19_11465 [Opitutaceae bacterium]|nr:hypothetical protein [Opitutaceae bacterium]